MYKRRMLAGVVLGVAAVVVAADYFALLGTSTTEKYDLITMNFTTVDEETGAPVTGVHARCFQANNNDACAEKSSDPPGTVSISIPVIKLVTRSYLFLQHSRLRETADPKIRIMFVHVDYARPVETFLVSELPELSQHVLTVTMPRSLAQ